MAARCPSEPSRFLLLPAELRLHLYEILLLDPCSYIVPIPNSPPIRANASKALHPAVLRVCKLVYNEAQPVLYSSHAFMVRTYPLESCVPGLTEYIGRCNAGLIRRVFTLGQRHATLDRRTIESKYRDMGINWHHLHVWACRASEQHLAESWLAEAPGDDAGEQWLVKANEMDMERLGLKSEWTDFGDEAVAEWVVKKGSIARASTAE